MVNLINPVEYSNVINRLRSFFLEKGFLETPVQHRLSILAACEDPNTVAKFNYMNNVWPLPQTGQMWLEYELLTKPGIPGFFCISTSYRNEPNPIEGRHDLIFPMFEFETHGNVDTLKQLEIELLEYLGFGKQSDFHIMKYRSAADHCKVKELSAEHEEQLNKEIGPVMFLTEFPEYTSPFWNMKRIPGGSAKIDVLLHGVETIGSAERSSNVDEMRDHFHTISDGGYAQLLYDKFGKQRVEDELNKFLELDFFDRCGGGIGVTRMIRACKLHNLL